MIGKRVTLVKVQFAPAGPQCRRMTLWANRSTCTKFVRFKCPADQALGVKSSKTQPGLHTASQGYDLRLPIKLRDLPRRRDIPRGEVGTSLSDFNTFFHRINDEWQSNYKTLYRFVRLQRVRECLFVQSGPMLRVGPIQSIDPAGS